MKRFITALLVCALTLLPFSAGASWYNPTAEELVRWAGCNAAVVVSDEHSAVESFYNGEAIYIGTRLDGISTASARMILFHEIGHCLQDQSVGGELDSFYMFDPVTFELDADRIAAELACSRGEDGVRLYRELLDWAHDTYDYNGDYGHGTLDQRKAAAASAQACQRHTQGA